jgi:hypothetical protein
LPQPYLTATIQYPPQGIGLDKKIIIIKTITRMKQLDKKALPPDPSKTGLSPWFIPSLP